MGFSEDIKKFQEKALLAANAATCKVFEELSTSVVDYSPGSTAKYATGLVKNSWYAQVGGVSNVVGAMSDFSGSASLFRIKAIVSQRPFYGKDNTVTLANNTGYVYRVEYLGWEKDDPTNRTGWDWTGTVAPYAMVSKSIAAIKGKYM